MPDPIIGGALIGGGLLGGGLLGGKESGAERSAEDLTDLQSQIARQFFEETAPLRGGTIPSLEQFLQTGVLPRALDAGAPPTFAPHITPLRESTEAQFTRARENIINRTGARGGQLVDRLAALEGQRAQAIGALELPFQQQDFAFQQQLFGQEQALRDRLFSGAFGAGLGAPGQTITGLAQASQGVFGTGQLAAQRQQAGGQLAGTGLGLGLKALGII